jgi:[protein-PII] uridylyltransferase
MIIQFAQQMGTSETLKMLYLLTYADLKAVGPDIWNDWKAMLMEELYKDFCRSGTGRLQV